MPHGFLALLFGQFEHRKKSQDKPGLQRGDRTRYNENLQLGDYPVHYDLPAPSLSLKSRPTAEPVATARRAWGNTRKRWKRESAGADEPLNRREWRDD